MKQSLYNGYARWSVLLMTISVTMLVTVGYLVVPILFTVLPQVQAGRIAAILFQYSSGITLLLITMVLLATVWLKPVLKQLKTVLFVWASLLVIKFGIARWMADIKARYPQGLDLTSADWKLFAMLHGVYQLFYLLIVITLCVWLWRALRQVSKP